MKVIIVILNYNGRADTLDCLASCEQLTYPDCELVVVDNGSTDDSVAALRARWPGVCLLETGANLGFAGGNNVGIRWALARGAEWILLLNNDTLVAPDLCERLLDAAQATGARLLGAKLLLYSAPDQLDHLGGIWDPATARFLYVGHRERNEGIYCGAPFAIDYVCGAALFAHVSLFGAIGLLEERFFLIWEESDFCFRARRAGYQVVTVPQAVVRHRVSASFTGGKPHSTYFWWRGRLFWLERNVARGERLRLYAKVIIPELLHLAKLALLQSLQLALLHVRRAPAEPIQRKQAKLRKTCAALLGAAHYGLRRFGNVPAVLLR